MHLQSKHGLADFEVQFLLAERDGCDHTAHGFCLTTGEDAAAVDAQQVLNAQSAPASFETRMDEYVQDDWGTETDAAVATGGDFWVGDRYEPPAWDEWDTDGRGMRRLIEEELDCGEGEGDEMVIDPTLV